MKVSQRQHGILLHPSSLPSEEGIGTLGTESKHFLRWLSETSAGSWQILPLVPICAGHSPYSSPSAFSGNPLLISLIELQREGWLTSEELHLFCEEAISWGLDEVHFDALIPLKQQLLNTAAQRFIDTPGSHHLNLEQFYVAQSDWLEEAALFQALNQSSDYQGPWWTWGDALVTREPTALTEAKAKYANEIKQFKVIQLWFQQQWDQLKSLADELNIDLIGDVPIYVDHHSADVWCNQELFSLTKTGSPIAVAGVPPDAFSDTGQLWGNPIYMWSKHLSSGYQWWIKRLRRSLSLTHYVRIDHFRAFAAYWSVPFGSPDASSGVWIKGPGLSLFKALREGLYEFNTDENTLPLIAEDLGLIDQPVKDLLESTKLPGMKVIQFAFDGEVANAYLPHNYASPHCVVYTGTHDNETTRAWWRSCDEKVKHQVRSYCSISGDEEQICWDLIRLAFSSTASLAIIPMQDLLSLGSDARMNTPSSPAGNWKWRIRREALNHEISHRLRTVALTFGRITSQQDSQSST